MSEFNGQINISRDLRQNKSVILGKFDLEDMLYIILGFAFAGITVYLLVFVLSITSVFVAMVFSVFPLLLVLGFGFKKISDIRYFDFLMMKMIDKKNKKRSINKRLSQSIEMYVKASKKKTTGNLYRFIATLLVDKKYVNKYIKYFLDMDNVVSVRINIKGKNHILYVCMMFPKKKSIIYESIINNFCKLKGISSIPIQEIYDTQQKIEHDNYKLFSLRFYDLGNVKKYIKTIRKYAETLVYYKRIDKELYADIYVKANIDNINNKANIIKKHKLSYETKKYITCAIDKQNVSSVSNVNTNTNTYTKTNTNTSYDTKINKIMKTSREYDVVLCDISKYRAICKNLASIYMNNTYNAYKKINKLSEII